MAKNSATEAELGDLHAKAARVMSKVLISYEKAQDEFLRLIEGGMSPEQLLEFPEIPPAMLSVIIKFLNDNKITAEPEGKTETSELAIQLANRQQRREQRRNNVTPFPTQVTG